MKRATLIQFDIETLSLHSTHAVVGEIGIHVDHLFLDTDGRVRVGSDSLMSVLLDMEEQQHLGRELDIKTIQWWLNQNETARNVMAIVHDRKHVFDAIQTIDAFVRKHMDIAYARENPVFILSSAPAFDMTNVRSLYEAAGMEHPWPPRQEQHQRHRDLHRTGRSVTPGRHRTHRKREGRTAACPTHAHDAEQLRSCLEFISENIGSMFLMILFHH